MTSTSRKYRKSSSEKIVIRWLAVKLLMSIGCVFIEDEMTGKTYLRIDLIIICKIKRYTPVISQKCRSSAKAL